MFERIVMSHFKRSALVVLAFAALLLIAVPLALVITSAMPSLFTSLSAADAGTVVISVAGAFGVGYVIAVPRDRNNRR
jgi:hypothetical protein